MFDDVQLVLDVNEIINFIILIIGLGIVGIICIFGWLGDRWQTRIEKRIKEGEEDG